jgi:putative ABC transport system permease protein
MDGWLVRLRVVSRDYFSTMGIPMLSGRDFQPQDEIGEIGNTKVIIVNQTMARLVWPGRNPVGEKVISEVEPNNAPVEVIVVVGDVKYTALDSEPVPEAYYPQGLYPQDEFSIVIRKASAPGAMTESVRAAVNEVERDVFITPFRTLDDLISTSLNARRFAMRLLSVFTATGMLLAVIGIAGIVAYSSSLRIREVGIRVTMGAGPRDVIALISRQGIAPALAGIALGLLIAANLTRFLGYMLYTVSPYDPTVFGSATAALALISVLVAGISTHRACRVDASSLLK